MSRPTRYRFREFLCLRRPFRLFEKKPNHKKKTIETLTNLTTKKLKIYSVKIQDVNEKLSFKTKLNKPEREVLLTLPNLKYSRTLKIYPHLKEVQMNDKEKWVNLFPSSQK